MIQRGGVDIVQPDMSRCGGLTVAKKIADMALLNGIEICPHAFKSGILMAASIQLLASYQGTPLLEYCSQETVLSKGLLKSHFALEDDGTVKVPDTPGLGRKASINKERERKKYEKEMCTIVGIRNDFDDDSDRVYVRKGSNAS